MKQTVYIETTVVSYLTSRPSKDIVIAGHQAATRDFWDQLDNNEVFISELVLNEASQGDEDAAAARLKELDGLQELEIDEDCRSLAKQLLKDRAIPVEYPEDALHIAVAAVHGVDVIATWNFKHINNPVTRHKVRQSVESHGYTCSEICSPDEFLGEEDYD